MDILKSRIRDYWTRRAPSFYELRLREFESGKRALWKAELERYLPGTGGLRILDIGTGTGFFAVLLGAEGNAVTGIDLSGDMISRAREAAERFRVSAEFYVMDAEAPELEPGSFDAIVTRNLSWTLPHLGRAYRSWYRLLKPGGVLVNFDADYCRVTAEAEDTQIELPPVHAHQNLPADMQAENEAITLELSAYQQPRPQWDVELLLRAGFERISIDAGVWSRIYGEADAFYNPVRIFTIAAYKP